MTTPTVLAACKYPVFKQLNGYITFYKPLEVARTMNIYTQSITDIYNLKGLMKQ